MSGAYEHAFMPFADLKQVTNFELDKKNVGKYLLRLLLN